MTDIKQIPTETLLADLEDTEMDINRCRLAKMAGQTHYSGGSIQDRLDANITIRSKIELELERRIPLTPVQAETNKQKRPYAAVLQVANYIVERLAPACERIEIAGSLRRKKAEVGDIEIVAVPRLNYDLLGEPMKQTQVDDLLMMSFPALRKNGQKYKQFNFMVEGGDIYQVDLFLQPDPATFGVNYMIRTGSAEFSHKMVTAKKFGGLMPNDLRVQDARVWRGHECLPTPEEGDLFRLWGMTFVQPEARV